MILASSWFGDIVSIAWHVVALVVIVAGLGLAGYVVLALLLWAATKVAHQALQATREAVYRERGTGVPALFTLIGAAGAAATQVVTTSEIAALLAILVAAVTFTCACLAESGKDRGARALGIAGSVLPYLAFTVACFASGRFTNLTMEEQVLVVGGLAVGWLGVLAAIVRHIGQPESPAI
ncbi:MAG TPA: hypothetical protein VNO20_11585 [Solirubrobacterales bacterium]|nr:hypothetical protein [Solirubrobacterales bacterium]